MIVNTAWNVSYTAIHHIILNKEIMTIAKKIIGIQMIPAVAERRIQTLSANKLRNAIVTMIVNATKIWTINPTQRDNAAVDVDSVYSDVDVKLQDSREAI